MTNPTDSTGAATTGRSPIGVIAGFDGSDGASAALAWAADKTARLGPVSPTWVFEPPTALEVLAAPVRRAEGPSLAEESEARIRAGIAEVAPELTERIRILEGHAGVQLVEAAKGAELLVVGSRGRSAVVAVMLGSVSTYCVKNSTVPVAVIPPGVSTDKPLSTIVVGVDGSSNAEQALKWAIDHVEPDGTVYAIGALSTWGYMAGEFDPPADVLEKQIEETVENTVNRVISSISRGPQIIIQVIPRDARVALPQLARSKADAMVIGARGTTGISHLLLGSVSTALIHHPAVPTVVIPRIPTEPMEES